MTLVWLDIYSALWIKNALICYYQHSLKHSLKHFLNYILYIFAHSVSV